jgi:hypothetical protein
MNPSTAPQRAPQRAPSQNCSWIVSSWNNNNQEKQEQPCQPQQQLQSPSSPSTTRVDTNFNSSSTTTTHPFHNNNNTYHNNNNRNIRLIVHFDINETIWLGDQAGGDSFHDSVQKVIAKSAFCQMKTSTSTSSRFYHNKNHNNDQEGHEDHADNDVQHYPDHHQDHHHDKKIKHDFVNLFARFFDQILERKAFVVSIECNFHTFHPRPRRHDVK